MISAFGVEHGAISKVAWKAWHPVPPTVNKIPRGKLWITSAPGRHGVTHHEAALVHRPDRPVGGLEHSSRTKGKPAYGIEPREGYITHVRTGPGFRRRGVASNLLAHARKANPVEHSTARSELGSKFARGTEAKTGGKPEHPMRDWDERRAHQLPRPKKMAPGTVDRRTREPYTTARGVLRPRHDRPQTVARARAQA